MSPTWLSLLPPFVVVVSVLIIKRLNISLMLGIATAALISTQGSIVKAVLLIIQRTKDHLFELDNIYIYVFLIAISSIITLLNYTGSISATTRIISKKIQSKRAIEFSSIFLSFLLSIDDYLSILTVGHVTRPLADRFAVARLKIAFLIHALAGPVVILVPISSWAAAILAQLDQAGISLDMQQNTTIIADPFFTYLHIIPFMFYPLLIIASVFFIVYGQFSFGPLFQYEQSTQYKNIDHKHDHNDKKYLGSITELLMPLILLPVGVIFGILYSGNYYIFGGNSSFLEAFKNNNQTFLVMCIVSILAFSISYIFSFIKKQVSLHDLPTIIGGGIRLMYSAIFMVMLAIILGVFLRKDLMTGTYLASLLLHSLPITLLPLMVFITSFIITMSTGSGWGTFALMIPIIIQMLISLFQLTPPIPPHAIPIFFPTMAAIFSGAVCGDHVSPFSETTIMTATSTATKPLEHFYTQFPYALPAIIGSVISFFISGLLSNYNIWVNFIFSLSAGLIICLTMLYTLNKRR